MFKSSRLLQYFFQKKDRKLKDGQQTTHETHGEIQNGHLRPALEKEGIQDKQEEGSGLEDK